jgi:hypothetical protein
MTASTSVKGRVRKIIARTMWTLVALATLIALFYAEEDWRGARAWQAAQAEYAKAGESLDYAKVIPPPIPDHQNLGALPLFAQEPISKKDPSLHPGALEKALRLGENLPQFPLNNGFTTGKPTDFAQLRRDAAEVYSAAFRGAPPPSSPLAQLEAVYPVILELRTASATRTSCRFDDNYAVYPPVFRSLTLLTDQIAIARLLSRDALLAIDAHRPDLALADLRAIFILSSGAGREPSLVGGLVAMGMRSIAINVIAQGLTRHAWTDAQLMQLQATLEPIDYFSLFRANMRSEAAVNAITYQYLRDNPSWIMPLLTGMAPVEDQHPRQFSFFLLSWPSGWMDEIRSQLVLFHLGIQATVDPAAHRIYPEHVRRLWDAARRGFPSLSRLWFRQASGVLRDVPFKFARGQTSIDQTIIACALERYRLMHGTYPASLAALLPDYCADLRHDVINGEPYRYRVLPDGSYRLYSIGWNETDDGGTLAFETVPYTSVPQINFDQGDWVWFGPK